LKEDGPVQSTGKYDAEVACDLWAVSFMFQLCAAVHIRIGLCIHQQIAQCILMRCELNFEVLVPWVVVCSFICFSR
jgi:hypothetical protein